MFINVVCVGDVLCFDFVCDSKKFDFIIFDVYFC